MNTTPSKIIAQFLRDAEVGSLPSANDEWPLYTTRMPDDTQVKDDIMSVIDAAGDKKGRLMNGEVITDRGVQILVRSVDHTTGWLKAEVAARFLDIIRNVNLVIDSNTYTINNCRRTGDIISMGQENNDKQRHMFSLNYLVSFKATFSDLYTDQVRSILAANTYNVDGTINSTEELNELIHTILP